MMAEPNLFEERSEWECRIGQGFNKPANVTFNIYYIKESQISLIDWFIMG